MSNSEDPILQEKSVTAKASIVEASPIDSGCKIIGMDKNLLNEIGRQLNDVYWKDGCARNGITLLHGALFAIDSKNYSNSEWREHSASSLREILHQWQDAGRISNAFNLAFPNNVPNMKSGANTYRRLQNYYGYFSSICHHDVVGETHALRQIHSETTKGSQDFEKIFLEMAKNFIEELRASLPK